MESKSAKDFPIKSILKQSPSPSPLHPNSGDGEENRNQNQNRLMKQQKFVRSRLRVSINLPDNEISLRQQSFREGDGNCAAAAAGAAAKRFVFSEMGHSKMAPTRDYSVNGSPVDQLFGTFNCISIIVNVYASLVIPEIQATIAPPVKGKMFKGLCLSFAVVVTTYFSVAISGYWAFGNESQGTVLSNFMGSNGHILLPKWLLVMINAFAFSQVFAVTLVYLQPTNEVLENWFADPKANQFATRNVIPRLFFRTLTVVSATFLAALLPFFGDIMALFGAFACIPLNLILPMIFYNITFKLSRKSVLLWMHRAIVVVSSVLVAIGAIASVRQIVLDAKTYSLFANV
ncbi:GABA transporter 1 [Linum perenne]